MHRLVTNTARFQVPDLLHLPAPKSGALPLFFSLFGSSPLQCPQFFLSWGAGYHKLSLLHSFDPHKGHMYGFGTILLFISVTQLA